MAGFQSLPGFRDFYPEDFSRRQHIFRGWRLAASAFGFQEYDAPVLEPLELYKAKSGDEIEAQLFSFTDKGGREVALRPEMTPTVCRMVGEKAGSLKRPIKWFSVAEFYRYERAQKGRLRAFHQLNADIFGEPGPEAEIELIALLIQCLAGFGLTKDDFYVRLSDRNLWFFYLEALGFSQEQMPAVLSAVDRIGKTEKGTGAEAFSIYEEKFGKLPDNIRGAVHAFSQQGGKQFSEQEILTRWLQGAAPAAREKVATRMKDFQKVIGGLSDMGLNDFIEIDMSVVRGLAYYTGFVFEAFDRKGDLRALAGGGRYNDLIKKLGGPDLPAVGFAIGDVTTGLLLEQRGLAPKFSSVSEVYVVIGGEAERKAAFADIQKLRAAGLRIEYPFKDMAFGKQFKAASESGARLALIYGGDELAKGVVKLRDLTDRSERDVPRDQVGAVVRELLGGH